jgi:hypothetical protein
MICEQFANSLNIPANGLQIHAVWALEGPAIRVITLLKLLWIRTKAAQALPHRMKSKGLVLKPGA